MPRWCEPSSSRAAGWIWRPPARCSWLQALGVDPKRCIHTSSDQARARYPQRARIRRAHLRRRQPRRGAQVQSATASALRCCCACRSAVRARCATCRASSAAIPRMRWRWRGWRPRSASTCRAFRFTSARRRPTRSSTSRRSRPARGCLATARRERLGTLDTLDIGGGFPIDYLQHAVDIRRFCAPIRAALARLPKRVRVIAEPGRYHRRSGGDRRGDRHGSRAARRPLVVLPR